MSAIGVAPTGDTWRARPLPLAAAGGVKRAQDVRPGFMRSERGDPSGILLSGLCLESPEVRVVSFALGGCRETQNAPSGIILCIAGDGDEDETVTAFKVANLLLYRLLRRLRGAGRDTHARINHLNGYRGHAMRTAREQQHGGDGGETYCVLRRHSSSPFGKRGCSGALSSCGAGNSRGC